MHQNGYPALKKLLLLFGFILFVTNVSLAQNVYLPYSYQLDQKFNADFYSTKTSLHTSLKPYLIDSAIVQKYNKLMSLGVDSNRKTWVLRKIYNEHLFDEKFKDYTFYGDYMADLEYGRDISGQKTTYLNTRGYQFGGTVGDKFSFYTCGYENQGVFAPYFDKIINTIHFVPGESYDRSFGVGDTKDWSYSTAIISYTPIKQLNITLGEDKTFIGDGYRSLLLSDYSAPYPLLRLTANVGNFQYMIMWSYLESPLAQKFDEFGSNRRKWGVFHYLDWNVNHRLSFGFFNALISAETTDLGVTRGFDLNYINPILFDKSLGKANFIPDNTYIGFTGKYKIFDKTAVYGQLFFDYFKASSILTNSVNNTNGVQLGIRGAELFGITNLNYIAEYNAVRPYTYSSNQIINQYTQYDEPLGDPLGSNFREYIGIINYSLGRFDFQGQLNYAVFGLDLPGQNDGGNVLEPFFQVPSVSNAPIGQGLKTTLYYGEGTVAYIFNPKHNSRIEIGLLLRDEKNALTEQKTALVTFGVRTSFRNLYHDF